MNDDYLCRYLLQRFRERQTPYAWACMQRCPEKRHRELFYSCQFFVLAVFCIINPLLYYSQTAHSIFALALYVDSIVSGARFYVATVEKCKMLSRNNASEQ